MKYKGMFSVEKGVLNIQVPLISFIDDNTHIIYCPMLDLSGYGMDETEARDSFNTVLQEFITYTTNKKSLWADLKKMGWIIKKSKKIVATPPLMSQLLEENEEFSRIFNNYPFKKFNTYYRQN